VIDYVLDPSKYKSGYDIKIVETWSDADLANAIAALPDHSQPRLEINGHGWKDGVELSSPPIAETSAAKMLGLDTQIGIDVLYTVVGIYVPKIYAVLDSVKIGQTKETAYIEPNDKTKFAVHREKFTKDPNGGRGPKKKPVIVSSPSSDYNGAFNGLCRDIEVLIDHAAATSRQPPEINMHSCSTGLGIANDISEWFGGVKVTAPEVAVSSKLVNAGGHVVAVYTSEGRPVQPRVFQSVESAEDAEE
jgi:hypothetical protein